MLGRLRLAQRVVLVVSLALTLIAVGLYVSTLGLSGTGGGIEKATFLSPSQPFTPPMLVSPSGPDLAPWQQLLVWIGLILVWASVSVVVLRPSRPPERESETVR